MRPVSDRPHRLAVTGARAYSDAGNAVARAVARRTAELSARTDRPEPERRAPDPAATRLAARPAAPGVETEVSIRVYADGGSISVVRHLRGAEVVGIEAMIR